MAKSPGSLWGDEPAARFFENGPSPKFSFVPEFCGLHFVLTMSASPHEDISMSPILVAMCENGRGIPFGLIF